LEISQSGLLGDTVDICYLNFLVRNQNCSKRQRTVLLLQPWLRSNPTTWVMKRYQ